VPEPPLHSEPFGLAPDRREVERHTMRNRNGLCVRLLTWGGVIQSIQVPDRHGRVENITLGFESLEDYIAPNPYFGALIGRFANRIAGGRFRLGDHEITLTQNDGPNHLHGGSRGFHGRVWSAELFTSADGAGAVLTCVSLDGEEGYEGEVRVRVVLTLDDANCLSFDYEATTDRPTPINLTQHSCFNLAGERQADILEHELTIRASLFTPVGAGLLPTGEIHSVSGTPFDFRQPALIGDRIGMSDEQLRLAGGFDHNFVLDRDATVHPAAGPQDAEAFVSDGALRRFNLFGPEPEHRAQTILPLIETARLVEPVSGRVLEVCTTEPGLQFFSGNFTFPIRGRNGRVYGPRSGLTLETQHFPDSPNQPNFPSTVLLPGQTFRSHTVYRFTIES
jgi:aldose 1-epimerase